jgi:hypothetical protein
MSTSINGRMSSHRSDHKVAHKLINGKLPDPPPLLGSKWKKLEGELLTESMQARIITMQTDSVELSEAFLEKHAQELDVESFGFKELKVDSIIKVGDAYYEQAAFLPPLIKRKAEKWIPLKTSMNPAANFFFFLDGAQTVPYCAARFLPPWRSSLTGLSFHTRPSRLS